LSSNLSGAALKKFPAPTLSHLGLPVKLAISLTTEVDSVI